jgi:diguanylate cyclase (GGDEF)-like protein
MNVSLSAQLRPRMGLTAWFVTVSVLAWAPMLVFASILVYQQQVEHQARGQASLARNAQAAATSVGHLLDSTLVELRSLARVDHIERGDMAAMHAYASRVVQVDDRVLAISMTDAAGHQIFNTLLPYGSVLPQSRVADLRAPLFSGARGLVSALVTGALDGTPVVSVAVPVHVQGSPQYALRATLNLNEIAERLADQAWPADWTATVLDQQHTIIAGSRDAQRHIGQAATESLSSGIRSGAAQFLARTKDGIEVMVSAAQVPGSEWVVAVGQPAAALRNEVRQSMVVVLVAGAICASLGIGLAILVARRLGAQMRGLVNATLQPGSPGAAPASQVAEVADLASELTRARQGQGRVTEELHRARRDALTGLAGRAQFLEAAGDLLVRSAGQAERGLGMLFIDLDGFKQANDRLGHDAGDRILQQVGSALRACIRADDVAGRLGGDEFVVCLQAHAPQVAEIASTLAERIVHAVSAIGEGVGCSIGVALARPDEELDTLVRRADQAMLAAKRAGKGRVLAAD